MGKIWIWDGTRKITGDDWNIMQEVVENVLTGHRHDGADSRKARHEFLENVLPNQHHTKFTITEHDVPERHPLTVLDPLVASEAEVASLIGVHADLPDEHWLKGNQYIVYPRIFDSVGSDAGGGGTASTFYGAIWTPAVLNSKAWALSGMCGWYNYPTLFDKNPLFEVLFRLDMITNLNAYLRVGGYYTTVEATDCHFGVKVANDKLRIISATESAYSETGDLMTLLVNTWYRLRVKLFSGNKVEAWINGTSVGTKTDNLPTGDLRWSYNFLHYQIVTLEASGKRLAFSATKLRWDY